MKQVNQEIAVTSELLLLWRRKLKSRPKDAIALAKVDYYRIGIVVKEFLYWKAQHKLLSLKEHLNASERSHLAQIPLKLARLESCYNKLATTLAPTQSTSLVDIRCSRFFS